ncbi:hypothetical protein [Marinitenerispora sediminis]|uniref:hypothetical protein n=1 Tax=Marinitenerispora sediminis TaxID=1931232 RepID=UPI0015F13FD0|nr:hypothetical protein [Marinitenerispora sediminis]
MHRFDSAAADLVPGARVRVRITGHEPWGVLAEVLGSPDTGASVDAGRIDSPSGSPRALPEEYPVLGSEVDAVVEAVRRWSPPAWVRLTLRAADLREFRWGCDLCGASAVLSPGGDGVVLDARSAEGPGATSLVVHRSCLVDRLHPTSLEGPRVRLLGRGR